MPPGVLKNRTTTSALSALGVRFALFLACGTLPSCGEPPAPAAPPHAPPPSAQPPSDAQARYGAVALASPPGTIVLYDPEHWRARRAGSFTVLEHPSSRSTLAIRLWRAARLVRPAECEAEARLARPELPRRDPDALIDERPLSAPREFSGSLVVGVEPDADGATRGFALAVGAAIGRCFVLAYDTRATGAGAASVVAERLRAAADAVVPSVELREVDERVQPEPLLK
jgi:hypothetical protein